MSVQDGQSVSAAVTNPAFLKPDVDDYSVSKLGGRKPTGSGYFVDDYQLFTNHIAEYMGLNTSGNFTAEADTTGADYGSTSNAVPNGTNYKVAFKLLSDKFASTTIAGGHQHTGADGDGAVINISTGTTGILAASRGGTGLDGSAAANGSLLIGNGTGYTLATLTGTSNQVTVTNGSGTITLSLPQDIAAASSPTFAGLTLTAFSGALYASAGALASEAQLNVSRGGTGIDGATAANGTLLIGNGSGYTLATLTGTANQVTVTNGSGSITLALPQSIATSSSPTFASLTLSGVLTLTAHNDNTSGGTATLATVTSSIKRLTNAGLTGVSDIPAPSGAAVLEIVNVTGGIVTFANNSTIITGTAASLAVANGASIWLVYDVTSTAWRVVGGSGGSGSGGWTNATFTGTSITTNTDMQRKYTYTGSSAQTLVSLGGSPSDGQVIRIFGSSDTNTLTIPQSVVGGLNGDIVLYQYSMVELQYDATLGFFQETFRRV